VSALSRHGQASASSTSPRYLHLEREREEFGRGRCPSVGAQPFAANVCVPAARDNGGVSACGGTGRAGGVRFGWEPAARRSGRL